VTYSHTQGKLFVCLLRISHTKPTTKFELKSAEVTKASSNFEDMFDRMPKIEKVK